MDCHRYPHVVCGAELIIKALLHQLCLVFFFYFQFPAAENKKISGSIKNQTVVSGSCHKTLAIGEKIDCSKSLIHMHADAQHKDHKAFCVQEIWDFFL